MKKVVPVVLITLFLGASVLLAFDNYTWLPTITVHNAQKDLVLGGVSYTKEDIARGSEQLSQMTKVLNGADSSGQSAFEYLRSHHDKDLLVGLSKNGEAPTSNVVTEIIAWERDSDANELLTSLASWFHSIANRLLSFPAELTFEEHFRLVNQSANLDALVQSTDVTDAQSLNRLVEGMERVALADTKILEDRGVNMSELLFMIESGEPVDNAKELRHMLQYTMIVADSLSTFKAYEKLWDSYIPIDASCTDVADCGSEQVSIDQSVELLRIVEKAAEENPPLSHFLEASLKEMLDVEESVDTVEESFVEDAIDVLSVENATLNNLRGG